ncbi:MAG TPA: hypothetical protein VE087_02865 [Xanthobacteraceae bacterium]|nr:hypothetical protein [Xanthobacteraceae bacterium]
MRARTREGRSHGGRVFRAIIRHRVMTESEADQRSDGESLFSHHDPTLAGMGRSRRFHATR